MGHRLKHISCGAVCALIVLSAYPRKVPQNLYDHTDVVIEAFDADSLQTVTLTSDGIIHTFMRNEDIAKQFNFSEYYKGYYSPTRFVDICIGDNGELAIVGVKDNGEPAMYLSNGGNVWSERVLVYTDIESGRDKMLEHLPLELRHSKRYHEYIIMCSDSMAFVVPACSHCNELLHFSDLDGIIKDF